MSTDAKTYPTHAGHKTFMRSLKKRKPMSRRRARELRDRWLKNMFGDRKSRAERFVNMTTLYGYDMAVQLSARGVSGDDIALTIGGCSCPECAPQY